ncbi:MAG: hypothetical protein GXP19_06500 [Gammaproteobacteria bacterium]|nr:hypothetical protein [Gammaproteobacteria bacterium]
MDKEKRKGENPVPDDVEEELSHPQLLSLRQIERFGWYLKFVRRPLFQERVAVVFSAEENKIGLLENDGKINMEPDIQVRELATGKSEASMGDVL